jgi:hypothetical protein
MLTRASSPKPAMFAGKEANLSEILSNYLEVLSARMVDLGEITAEYTLSGNSIISNDLHEGSGVTQWTAQSSALLTSGPSGAETSKTAKKNNKLPNVKK